MDAEQSQEVADLAPETPETGPETVPASASETEEKVVESEKPTEPEKSPEKSEAAARSPEKASSGTVTECHNQPGDIQNPGLEQQPMAEKTPEALPLAEPLAESNTEGTPAQFAEPAPQSEPTLPEPVTPPPFEEVKPFCQAKEVPEQPEKQVDIQMVTPEVEPKTQSEPEIVKEAVEEAVKVEAENPEKILNGMEAEKPAELQAVEEVVPEKLAEPQTTEEVVPEKPAEPQTTEEVVPEKPIAAQTVDDVITEKPTAAQTVDDVITEKPIAAQTVDDVITEKPTAAQAVDDVITKKPVAAQTVDDVITEKPIAAQTVDDVATEKPVEVVCGKEASPEKPLEPCEALKEPCGEKPAEPETVEEEKKEEVVAESTAEGAVETAAPQEAEPVKEEEEEPMEPAPGTLSFALLEQEITMATLRTSRTLVVLKGLPGSGKTLLARAIAENYKDLCTVFRADDHGVKPESPEASADAHYNALDEAVAACCSAGTAASMVVVDDTNHTPARLARLGELAEQHRLVAVFLEPRTEWSRDVPQLAKKSQRGLEEAKIKAMVEPLEETTLPLFFGWFLLHGVQDKVRCMSMDFLKTLDTLEAFQKHLTDFTGEAGKEVDLEQYFQTKGDLHCTTKFCDYGKAEGAKEYAEIPAVSELYGSAFELSLSALFVTPRTVGARVSLSDDQLVLWPADPEKDATEAPAADAPPPAVTPPLPRGSRAHVTLGCAEGVEPVQTGLDLLEILALQQEGEAGELVEEMELGSLAYYGKGRWLLVLREPVAAQACFSSRYHPKKEEPAKKEEKKKKPKCTIL